MTKLQPQTRRELPALCDYLGLPTAPDDPALSKREYLESRLKRVRERQVKEISERFAARYPLRDCPETFDIQEALWNVDPPFTIPKKLRRELARQIEGLPLYLRSSDPFMDLLGRLFALGHPLDRIFGSASGLAREIRQHVILNPGDWDVEELFEQLGALQVSDRRFAQLLEGLASSDLRPDETAQLEFVQAVNSTLRTCGVELREVDSDGGYPVFRAALIGTATGRPKNIIFASSVKPDIRFRDAVNNDIEIVTNADQVLVFDRPIPAEGLRWADLQEWWAQERQLDAETAKKTLYGRLQHCLPTDSPPQRLLFREFFSIHAQAVPFLPALLPEVWLHWDPKTVRERGPEALLRHRMDFLMLFSTDVRVVIEVDGRQHYANHTGRADPSKYAKMAAADRELRLAGYEVYRFGGSELTGAQAKANVRAFFDSLFRKHGVGPHRS